MMSIDDCQNAMETDSKEREKENEPEWKKYETLFQFVHRRISFSYRTEWSTIPLWSLASINLQTILFSSLAIVHHFI